MKKFTDWLFGYFCIAVTGADISRFLNRLTKSAVPFWNICQKDAFCVSVCIYRRDLMKATDLATASMCQTENVCERGLPRHLRGLRRRVVLLSFLTAAVLAAILVPRFIWFYAVEGNTSVPSEKIIRAVQSSGVNIGTYGKKIEPLLVRDAVLSEIPELAWLTVTQSGGKATIVVREKRLPEPVEDRRTPRNVVAARAGLITDISVLEGGAAVKKGDVVTEGQLLISGYMDLEYKYRVCGAKGEIYARTWRQTEALTPEKCMKKRYTGKEKNIISFCFGKKRIKLSLGSGILPTGCDKMTKSTLLTLPGGYALPVGIVTETYRFYDAVEALLPETEAKLLLREAALDEAKRQMVAGTVRKEDSIFAQKRGCYEMKTTLECEEMIARTTEAEIFKGEMKNDGTSN